MLTTDTTVPNVPNTPDKDEPLQRYIVGKFAAGNEILAYSTSERAATSQFSIVNIFAGYVFGPDEMARTKADFSNSMSTVLDFLFTEMDTKFGMGHQLDLTHLLCHSSAILTDVRQYIGLLAPPAITCLSPPIGAVWASLY